MKFFVETWKKAIADYPGMAWLLGFTLWLLPGVGLTGVLVALSMAILFVLPYAFIVGRGIRKTHSAEYRLRDSLPQYLVVTGTMALAPVFWSRADLPTFLIQAMVGWSMAVTGFLIGFSRTKPCSLGRKGAVHA